MDQHLLFSQVSLSGSEQHLVLKALVLHEIFSLIGDKGSYRPLEKLGSAEKWQILNRFLGWADTEPSTPVPPDLHLRAPLGAAGMGWCNAAATGEKIAFPKCRCSCLSCCQSLRAEQLHRGTTTT